MNCEDISKFVHGCDISDLKGLDFYGHIGIVMMYNYVSKQNFDLDKFCREYQFDKDSCKIVYSNFENNGYFNKNNWPWRNKNILISTLRHKSKSVIRDWCHIAGIASGYTGK